MTDNTEQKSPSSSETSNVEQIQPTESTTSDTITALINAAPVLNSNTIDNSGNDSAQNSRRRSSGSILQALLNTSHLLTINDARKR
jgi:hypothetical protein